MISRIPAGKHRARPLRFGLWWRRTHFSWVVKFNESCRYDLQNEDQFDTNKLIGIGYLPGHHKDSARFGWRYWTDRKEVELSAYCYVNGQRMIQHICFLQIGKEYHIILNVTHSCYHLHTYEKYSNKYLGMATIQHYHHKKFQYRLGTYFGGNRPAPHEIKIQLERY